MPNWDTSLVTDMSGYDGIAFQGFGQKSTFNGDISKWNTEKVSDMYAMFYSASAFNQDIGSWNTEKVTNMLAMFELASVFNQDIGSWNTEKVTDMKHMMELCSKRFSHYVKNYISMEGGLEGKLSSFPVFLRKEKKWIAAGPRCLKSPVICALELPAWDEEFIKFMQ